MDAARTRYVQVEGAHLAYQSFGDGPALLVMLGMTSHVEAVWDEPALARFLRRLASFATTIVFDRRGSGLSDPLRGRPTTDSLANDASEVLDALGLHDVTVLAANEASLTAIPLAALRPDRVSGLVLVNGTARLMWADDYPIGVKVPQGTRYLRDGTEQYAEKPVGISLVAPSKVGDAVFEAWARSFQRSSSSPGGLEQTAGVVGSADVRSVLPDVRCPALVMHRIGNRFTILDHGLFLADHLPHARFVELSGADHLVWIGPDTDRMLDEIETFVTGSTASGGAERVLATILFTDIVGSTEQLTRLGDRAWAELVDTHDLTVRNAVERFQGRVVDTTGDGVFALFDSPSSALRAATRIHEQLRAVGLDVRAGVHTGEIEVIGAAARGVAVHTAARVMSVSGGGRIVASRTVRDLTIGSGFGFTSLGLHELKGLPEPLELFEVCEMSRT
jgi:class 3 adenylate cyclase